MTGNIATRAIRVHDADNVATAIADIAAGERLFADSTVRASVDLGRGHKVAIEPIARGAAVIKYGFPIGTATTDIAPGEHVHSHNLATALSGDGDYLYAPDAGEAAQPGKTAPTFRGYVRPDGRVGTRNEIWILPTVGCVGNLAARVARIAGERHAGRVDGVHAFKHPFGCSQLGDDLGHTRALLAALAQHPNAGGVLIVGLGCESNQLGALLDLIPAERRAHIRTLSAQAVEDDEEACLESIDALVDGCADTPRSDVPLSKLVLGVKCGGSDGFSGLSANPALGHAADLLIQQGGTVVITEVPEFCGAEHILAHRAKDRATGEAVYEMVDWYKVYASKFGSALGENPSPGNVAGGLLNITIKSLGAIAKAGTTRVEGCCGYAEVPSGKGLWLMQGPGYDQESTPGLVAAGSQLVVFTTGRGTTIGNAIAPVVKLASNTAVHERMSRDLDLSAGGIIDGTDTIEDVGSRVVEHVIRVASGEVLAKAEESKHREFQIWAEQSVSL